MFPHVLVQHSFVGFPQNLAESSYQVTFDFLISVSQVVSTVLPCLVAGDSMMMFWSFWMAWSWNCCFCCLVCLLNFSMFDQSCNQSQIRRMELIPRERSNYCMTHFHHP